MNHGVPLFFPTDSIESLAETNADETSFCEGFNRFTIFFLFLFFVQVWIIVQRNLLSISSRNRLTLQSLSVPFIPKDKKGTRVGIVPPKKRHGEIQHPLLLARLLVELASSCRRG